MPGRVGLGNDDHASVEIPDGEHVHPVRLHQLGGKEIEVAIVNAGGTATGNGFIDNATLTGRFDLAGLITRPND